MQRQDLFFDRLSRFCTVISIQQCACVRARVCLFDNVFICLSVCQSRHEVDFFSSARRKMLLLMLQV